MGKRKSLILVKDVPIGQTLKDLRKDEWVTGKSIGSGGFGFIYLAQKKKDDSTKATLENAKYVVKIEPKGSGPLAVETVCYQRAAKKEKIEEWKKSRKLKFLSIPAFVAQGIHQLNNKQLRFLVMPRFGSDLHKIWLNADKKFHRSTVNQVAVSLLHGLEYLHENNYVHADIKGANILVGADNPNQVYLVDFGLAFRYKQDGKHKELKVDPRTAHNGTIEYTSTDAHNGITASRRGDVEILGLVLLHWLCGELPWESCLTNANKVRDMKREFLDDVKTNVKNLLPDDTPDEIVTILEHGKQLGYEEKPDYKMLHNALNKSLKSMKISQNSPVDWSSANLNAPKTTKKTKPLVSKTNTKKTPQPRGRKADEVEEEDDVKVEKKRKVNKSQTAKTKQAKKAKLTTPLPKTPLATVDEMSEDGTDSEDLFATPTLPAKKQTKTPRGVRKQLNMEAFMTSDSDSGTPEVRNKKAASYTAGSRISTRSSRYSMAPLHTEPVLSKGDKLTGETRGKHKVIVRKKRKNVPKSDASTQVTPTLAKNSRRRGK